MASVTKFVGTASSVAGTGALAWTNPGNVVSDNGSFATVTSSAANQFTQDLLCTMTGNVFAIPAGSRIDGVSVEYEAQGADGSGATYNGRRIQLVVGGVGSGQDLRTGVGTNVASPVVVTHGGATQRWGLSLTPAAVNASDFGVVLTFQRGNSATARTLNLDYVKITVYYTEAADLVDYDADFAMGLCLGTAPSRSTTEAFQFRFPGAGTAKGARFGHDDRLADPASRSL
jgi:hypothetical protein